MTNPTDPILHELDAKIAQEIDTISRLKEARALIASTDDPDAPLAPTPHKPRRGRPKGSKNRTKAEIAANPTRRTKVSTGRPVGRPRKVLPFPTPVADETPAVEEVVTTPPQDSPLTNALANAPMTIEEAEAFADEVVEEWYIVTDVNPPEDAVVDIPVAAQADEQPYAPETPAPTPMAMAPMTNLLPPIVPKSALFDAPR